MDEVRTTKQGANMWKGQMTVGPPSEYGFQWPQWKAQEEPALASPLDGLLILCVRVLCQQSRVMVGLSGTLWISMAALPLYGSMTGGNFFFSPCLRWKESIYIKHLASVQSLGWILMLMVLMVMCMEVIKCESPIFWSSFLASSHSIVQNRRLIQAVSGMYPPLPKEKATVQQICLLVSHRALISHPFPWVLQHVTRVFLTEVCHLAAPLFRDLSASH